MKLRLKREKFVLNKVTIADLNRRQLNSVWAGCGLGTVAFCKGTLMDTDPEKPHATETACGSKNPGFSCDELSVCDTVDER